MFAVIFEVNPKPDKWDAYLGYAKALRPELLQVDGFIDNIRYRSKRREGWLLSLSSWRDEKALVRWRTHVMHHEIQKKGRFEIFRDYHLRVGQVTTDTHIPNGQNLQEQRLDETETGVAKMLSIIEIQRPINLSENASAEVFADHFDLYKGADGFVEWDIFEAILTPGDFLLLLAWQNARSAEQANLRVAGRERRIRVIRDYGMYDRYEAPQYYPNVIRPADTICHKE